jgi:hypothetical protein
MQRRCREPGSLAEKFFERLDRPGHHGLAALDHDGALDEPRVLRHERQDLGIGVTARGQAIGLVGGVLGAQDLPGGDPELAAQLAELLGGERSFEEIDCLEALVPVRQEVDRLPAGGSGGLQVDLDLAHWSSVARGGW